MTNTEYYLQFIKKVEQVTPTRYMFYINDNFIVEALIVNHDLNSKNDLMRLWKKSGFIKKMFSTHICIDTYYTDKDGMCWGFYNITHTPEHKIDFNYILEATEENIKMLVAECIRMYEMNIKH